MSRPIFIALFVAMALVACVSPADAFHRKHGNCGPYVSGYACPPAGYYPACYGQAGCYPADKHCCWPCPVKCLLNHLCCKIDRFACTYPAWWNSPCASCGQAAGYGVGAHGYYGGTVVSDCALGSGYDSNGCGADGCGADVAANDTVPNGAPTWSPTDATGPVEWSDRLLGDEPTSTVPEGSEVEDVPGVIQPAPTTPTPDEGASVLRARQAAFRQLKQANGAGAAAFEKGFRLMRDGSLQSALAEFELASKAEPRNPLYHYFVALTLYSLSGADAAADALRTAVRLEAEQPIGDWGKRMERIQGRQRAWVENARRDAGIVR